MEKKIKWIRGNEKKMGRESERERQRQRERERWRERERERRGERERGLMLQKHSKQHSIFKGPRLIYFSEHLIAHSECLANVNSFS